jgi:hypothetical protein
MAGSAISRRWRKWSRGSPDHEARVAQDAAAWVIDVSGRLTRRQNLHQHRQVLAQALSAVRDQMGHAVGVVRARSDAVRQADRMVVHLLEQVPNQGMRMLGMKRTVPFQGVQQLLPDRWIVRMAPGTQACCIQSLGLPVKSAEQASPIRNVSLRGATTPSDSVTVECRRVKNQAVCSTCPSCGDVVRSETQALK